MLPVLKGSIEQHLLGLDRIQSQLDRAESEVSSGHRVQKPSDDPAAAASMLTTTARIARATTIQKNLDAVAAEAESADAALQTAAKLLDWATRLAAEGASSTTVAGSRAAIAVEVKAVLEQMVSLSRTTSGGQYVFSGDLGGQPLYEYDSQTSTVKQLASTKATRQVEGTDGMVFAPALTATEIFDVRNASGNPAEGNIFAALKQLQQALEQDDTAGVLSATGAIDAATSHLGRQVAHYGSIQASVQSASDIAYKFTVQQQAELGNLRDADLPDAALRMSQGKIQQEAALAAASKILGQNLFDFLA
jgi:flagellar hook-associated protein 3 FlgL